MRDLHYKHWLITKSWLISFQELEFEGISLDRNPTTDLEDQFTACVKDRVSFKVWTQFDNHNSWADTKCNNIDQFVDI